MGGSQGCQGGLICGVGGSGPDPEEQLMLWADGGTLPRLEMIPEGSAGSWPGCPAPCRKKVILL